MPVGCQVTTTSDFFSQALAAEDALTTVTSSSAAMASSEPNGAYSVFAAGPKSTTPARTFAVMDKSTGSLGSGDPALAEEAGNCLCSSSCPMMT